MYHLNRVNLINDNKKKKKKRNKGYAVKFNGRKKVISFGKLGENATEFVGNAIYSCYTTAYSIATIIVITINNNERSTSKYKTIKTRVVRTLILY